MGLERTEAVNEGGLELLDESVGVLEYSAELRSALLHGGLALAALDEERRAGDLEGPRARVGGGQSHGAEPLEDEETGRGQIAVEDRERTEGESEWSGAGVRGLAAQADRGLLRCVAGTAFPQPVQPRQARHPSLLSVHAHLQVQHGVVAVVEAESEVRPSGAANGEQAFETSLLEPA